MKDLFYKSLKKYTSAALWFYFKKWQVRFVAPVPDGPVIFVANHQNAFLDAVILGCSTHRDPWFLTRANVFQKDLVKKILNALKMTPVYRFRDGFSTLRKNDEVIDNCVKLLKQKEAILIFGEGNHDEHWRLRPLQKGFARIALKAEEENNWNLNVKIVPVGLQYDDHKKFRSRVLITFGEPISVKNLLPANLNSLQQIELLVTKISEAIKPLMLHIDQPDYEKKAAYFLENRIVKNDLAEQLASDQQIVANTPSLQPETKVFKEHADKSTPWWNPFFVYQFINHLFPWAIIRWVITTKVKDPQFIGSIKFALGMVVVPVFYILQTTLCYSITNSWTISGAYFLSLPLSVLLRR